MYKISLSLFLFSHSINFRSVNEFSFPHVIKARFKPSLVLLIDQTIEGAWWRLVLFLPAQLKSQGSHHWPKIEWKHYIQLERSHSKSSFKEKEGNPNLWETFKTKLVHKKDSKTPYNHQDVKENPDPSTFRKEQMETWQKNPSTDYANCRQS